MEKIKDYSKIWSDGYNTGLANGSEKEHSFSEPLHIEIWLRAYKIGQEMRKKNGTRN